MVIMGEEGRKEMRFNPPLYLANGHSEQQSPGGFIPRREDGHGVDERDDPVLNDYCTTAHQHFNACIANIPNIESPNNDTQEFYSYNRKKCALRNPTQKRIVVQNTTKISKMC